MENAPLINEAVANIVKALRKKSQFTQEQLAGFAKTSRSQIAQLEAGKRGVTLHSLYWLAESFNIPFADFLAMIAEERYTLSKPRECCIDKAGIAANCRGPQRASFRYK